MPRAEIEPADLDDTQLFWADWTPVLEADKDRPPMFKPGAILGRMTIDEATSASVRPRLPVSEADLKLYTLELPMELGQTAINGISGPHSVEENQAPPLAA